MLKRKKDLKMVAKNQEILKIYEEYYATTTEGNLPLSDYEYKYKTFFSLLLKMNDKTFPFLLVKNR